jgi:CRP/FNR family cyclic AMP-dependent transcriptional regulator
MSKDSQMVLERRFVPEGAIVFEEGDDSSCAFLLQSGSVRVYTQQNGARVELATLGTGQIFGELALLFDGRRMATVAAVEDCNLIVITRQSLQQKLSKTDPTVKALVNMLSQRIVDSNNVVVNKMSDASDLKQTARIIYQNVLEGLPDNQRTAFQNDVLPSLDGFLGAIGNFQDEYK